MADLVDFSSFHPAEEKAFVPFEQFMRDNAKRSATIGLAIGGALFALVSAVVLTMYTPCTRFCERPPNSCDQPAQIANFKSVCWEACRGIEHESNLSITREVKDEKTNKMNEEHDTVGGSEFVEVLAACAFSGGAGATCESVTKHAETKGIWCTKK